MHLRLALGGCGVLYCCPSLHGRVGPFPLLVTSNWVQHLVLHTAWVPRRAPPLREWGLDMDQWSVDRICGLVMGNRMVHAVPGREYCKPRQRGLCVTPQKGLSPREHQRPHMGLGQCPAQGQGQSGKGTRAEPGTSSPVCSCSRKLLGLVHAGGTCALPCWPLPSRGPQGDMLLDRS